MWCLLASLVSPSASAANSSEPTTPATDGHIPSGSFAKYDPDTHFWRTSQGSLPGFQNISPRSSVIWPKRGTMRNGRCWEPTTPMRPTAENVSGFWRTPDAASGGGLGEEMLDRVANGQTRDSVHAIQMRLEDQVRDARLWPTPCASDYRDRSSSKKMVQRRIEERRQNSLEAWVRYPEVFPTPTATAWKGWSEGHNRADSNDRIDYTIEREAHQTGQRGRLNPEWVEWLMGWPIGHTGLEPLATDRCREWWRWHGRN